MNFRSIAFHGKKRFLFFIGAAFFVALTVIDAPVVTAQDKPQTSTASDYWKKQKQKASEERAEPVGLDVNGLDVPSELKHTKQFAKLTELIKDTRFKFPMDFVDLAEHRSSGVLVDVPLVNDNYFLEVGASSTKTPFDSFSFEKGKSKITPARFKILSALAKDFGGQKYDLNKPGDRKQMRQKLLSMLTPAAKIILDEIASEYKNKFDRPLRVTSLVRSMDYQIELNRLDPNSYRVRGAGSLPPHVSGFAFDIAFRDLTAAEQNFLMRKIAQLEKEGKVDGLREEGTSQVLHVFVHPSGQ